MPARVGDRRGVVDNDDPGVGCPVEEDVKRIQKKPDATRTAAAECEPGKSAGPVEQGRMGAGPLEPALRPGEAALLEASQRLGVSDADAGQQRRAGHPEAALDQGERNLLAHSVSRSAIHQDRSQLTVNVEKRTHYVAAPSVVVRSHRRLTGRFRIDLSGAPSEVNPSKESIEIQAHRLGPGTVWRPWGAILTLTAGTKMRFVSFPLPGFGNEFRHGERNETK